VRRERSEKDEAGNDEARETWLAERAVVLQVLRDDRHERWSRAVLAGELADVERAAFERALARLEAEDVLDVEGCDVRASRAARHLDELELIAV